MPLHFTGNAEADDLLADDPMGLIKALGAVLAKRFDVAVAQDLVPGHPTLGDVDFARGARGVSGEEKGVQGEPPG
jgi:hypothetical protein